MIFEYIKISDKLSTGSHSTIKFLEGTNIARNDDKENAVFLFGSTAILQSSKKVVI